MKAAKDISQILEMGYGFCRAKVVLTAVEFEVFTILGDRSMTAEELGATIGLHPRTVWDFFDTLVALGLLERDGDGREARYRNTEVTGRYLHKGCPDYVGSILEYCNDRTYKAWGELGSALKTGRAPNGDRCGQTSIFDILYKDPKQTERFMDAMGVMSRRNFEAFLDKFDLSRYRRLCDVGGATGLLSRLAVRRHPHLRCISFDLPEVEPIVRNAVDADGLSDRIEIASGNFFHDPLPSADIVTMGMILHDWGLEEKKHLVRSAYAALRPGGAFVAIENLIDEARRENVSGLIMSLNMLVEFGDAFDFTGADFWDWCREAGFKRHEIVPLTGASSAAVAYK